MIPTVAVFDFYFFSFPAQLCCLPPRSHARGSRSAGLVIPLVSDVSLLLLRLLCCTGITTSIILHWTRNLQRMFLFLLLLLLWDGQRIDYRGGLLQLRGGTTTRTWRFYPSDCFGGGGCCGKLDRLLLLEREMILICRLNLNAGT